MKKITIKEIAANCGVSIATISRAINNSGYVKPEIRDKILHYIDDIGWRNNNLASRLPAPSGKERSVWLVVSNEALLSPEFDRPLVTRVLARCEAAGYAPVLMPGRINEVLKLAERERPHALVVFHANPVYREIVREFLKRGIRTVTVGEELEYPGVMIHPDHRSAARLAAGLLVKAGHRRIAFFGGMGMEAQSRGMENVPTQRLRAMLEGIGEAVPGFDLRRDAVSDCFGELDALKMLLLRGEHTGWICSNYRQCCQFYYMAEQLKLRIPRDRSVITFSVDEPEWLFPGKVCRLTADNDRRAEQVVRQLDVLPVLESREELSECILQQGGSIRRVKIQNKRGVEHKVLRVRNKENSIKQIR